MGGRILRYVRQLLRIAMVAALPCVIIMASVLASFVLHQKSRELILPPAVYLRMLGLCYAVAFIATAVVEYRSLVHAATKTDEHLIGKTFGGLRKQDIDLRELLCTQLTSIHIRKHCTSTRH